VKPKLFEVLEWLLVHIQTAMMDCCSIDIGSCVLCLFNHPNHHPLMPASVSLQSLDNLT
jgi:hypothetical protein